MEEHSDQKHPDLVHHLSCSSSALAITTKENASPQLVYTCLDEPLQIPALEDEGEKEEEESNDDQEIDNDTDDQDETYTIQSERTLANIVWELDQQASSCRRCNRSFNFLVRRHHCRRCGQIVCDRCSNHRIRLPFTDIIQDPMIDPSQFTLIAKQPQRVCDICVRPISKQVDIRRSDSFQSLMVECPVCTISLLGMRKWDAENHLRQCFSEDNPPVPATRYVVYRLYPAYSNQIGEECPICFEEFIKGDKVARVICLCLYHERCFKDWLIRGKGCPVHYSSNAT